MNIWLIGVVFMFLGINFNVVQFDLGTTNQIWILDTIQIIVPYV